VDIPVERGEFPIDAVDIPIERGEFPIDAVDIPVERGEFPVDAVDIPVERGEFHAERGDSCGVYDPLLKVPPASRGNRTGAWFPSRSSRACPTSRFPSRSDGTYPTSRFPSRSGGNLMEGGRITPPPRHGRRRSGLGERPAVAGLCRACAGVPCAECEPRRRAPRRATRVRSDTARAADRLRPHARPRPRPDGTYASPTPSPAARGCTSPSPNRPKCCIGWRSWRSRLPC
jgi:hypothetical protein